MKTWVIAMESENVVTVANAQSHLHPSSESDDSLIVGSLLVSLGPLAPCE